MKHKILSLFLISWIGLYLAEDISDLIFTKEKVKIEDVKEGEESKENKELKEKEYKFYELSYAGSVDWLVPFHNFPFINQLSHDFIQSYQKDLYRLYHTYVFYD